MHDKLSSRPLRFNQAPVCAARLMIAVVILSTCSCSQRPSRIQAIDVDPGWLSDKLIAEHDADGDKVLSESELQAIPPIYDARSAYDTDGDGQISAAEMSERFTRIFDPNRGGLLPARCRVTQNGRPLAGAEVRFVPPKVLEGVLPPASGVTEQDGTSGLRLAPEDLPDNVPSPRVVVMRPGIYLVEVTHPSVDIPARYNTQTTLGKEVFSEVLNGPPLSIELEM